MQTSLEPEQLYHDLQAGKQAAYEYIFATYYPRLCNYARHFIDDAEAAEDLVQESLLQLWEQRATLLPVSVKSLLFTMVRNSCLNHLKHTAVVSQFKMRYAARHRKESEQLYHIDFLNDAEQRLLCEELNRRIDEILSLIPERSKEIFMLSRHDGLKNREIAARLDISVKVVERHISRALQALQQHLGIATRHELGFMLLFWASQFISDRQILPYLYT